MRTETGMGLSALVSNAVAPWKSADADFPLGTHDSNVDSQEQIDKCLNCWYPVCLNCIAEEVKLYDEDPNTINMAQLNMCITIGMNQKDTCDLMHISKTSYYRAKRKLMEEKK